MKTSNLLGGVDRLFLLLLVDDLLLLPVTRSDALPLTANEDTLEDRRGVVAFMLDGVKMNLV
jgi:hypothetical protein